MTGGLKDMKNDVICQIAQSVIIRATCKAFFQAARELTESQGEKVRSIIDAVEKQVMGYAEHMGADYIYCEDKNDACPNENITVGELMMMGRLLYHNTVREADDREGHGVVPEVIAESLLTDLITPFALIYNYGKKNNRKGSDNYE